MSASMVRKSLSIVDSDFSSGNKHKKKKDNIKNLIPDNHKIIKKITKNGKKEKKELLQTHSKLTVAEAKKNQLAKKEIVNLNLKKLKLIREACTIHLDKDISKQIIQRAVTKRPVKAKQKSKKSQKTAFTEEDFKKFEAEYIDE